MYLKKNKSFKRFELLKRKSCETRRFLPQKYYFGNLQHVNENKKTKCMRKVLTTIFNRMESVLYCLSISICGTSFKLTHPSIEFVFHCFIKEWNKKKKTAWLDMSYFSEIFMRSNEIRWNHILNWYIYTCMCLCDHVWVHINNALFLSFLPTIIVPVVTMEALIGETVYLPCNVSTHDVNDDVVLVLWYRADKGTPVYR